MVIQTRLFGRYFLKSEWILSLQGKQLPAANDKIKGLERRVGSWKCLSTTINLKIFQYLKDFSDGTGVYINKSDYVSVSERSM